MAVQEHEQVGGGSAAAATAQYVYGVVAAASSAAPRTPGLGGARVELLPFREVAALVSPVALPIRAKRRELLSHSAVVNEVAATHTVLPLSFGTTFPERNAIVGELLEPRHDELTRLLAHFEGHVELMVKAYYREEAILAEIVRDEPRIARLRQATRERPAAAVHGERIELGSAVAAALEARAAADGAAILDVLSPLARDVHVDETPIEHQVLRASVLVARRNVSAVDSALEALAQRNAGRIHFKYVGPLAPHSFVSLTPGEAR